MKLIEKMKKKQKKQEDEESSVNSEDEDELKQRNKHLRNIQKQFNFVNPVKYQYFTSEPNKLPGLTSPKLTVTTQSNRNFSKNDLLYSMDKLTSFINDSVSKTLEKAEKYKKIYKVKKPAFKRK